MSRKLALSLVWLCACGTGDVDDRQTAILEIDGDPINGADVYDAECAGCHGIEGQGNTGPSMAAVVAENDEAEMVDVVLMGADGMPDFEDLSDQDIADVVTHLLDTY